MALTPAEILHKEFDSKFRGYDPDQVNDFLDVIVADFEKLTLENKELSNRINDMQDKLNYFQQLQDSLNNSIVVAQEAAERLKQNARKEAELILYEAEREADKIYENAATKSKLLVQESENLRKYSVEFRDRLVNMVEAQLSLINKDEYQDLFEVDQVIDSKSAPKLDIEGSVKDRVTALNDQDTDSEGNVEALELDFDQVMGINPDLVNVDRHPMEDDPMFADDILTQIEPENTGSESVLGRTIRIDLPS